MTSSAKPAGFLIILPVILFFSGCSINTLALRAAADALSDAGSGTVFTGDSDPELVADAIPFAIKIYEALLDQLPDHDGLALTTGSLFVMYANAFVQTQAEMMGDEEYEQKMLQIARARNLYIRGFRILAARLEAKYPGISKTADEKTRKVQLSKCKKADVPFLYWISAAGMAAFALDPLNVELGTKLVLVRDFMAKAYSLDSDFNRGALDDFYVSYYAGLPSGMGGSMENARNHLEIAITKGAGKNASPFVSAATAIAVPNQDYRLFKEMLAKALAVNPDDDVANRLANIITQRKARYLLASAEYLFISIEEPTEGETE